MPNTLPDPERLRKLLAARYRGVRILTLEEDYAVQVVRDAALALARPLWLWSLTGGIQNGLLSDSPPLTKTEDPLAALQHFAGLESSALLLMLDLTPHLRNERILRALRNLLRGQRERGGQLILIDHSDELPAVIQTQLAAFDLSLPRDAELEEIIRACLRKAHRESPVTVDIRKSALQAIIRNLRGLTRRQAEQIIFEAICEDRRFDEADLTTVLVGKRRALRSGGLLEFVEAPASLDEIGGLRRLKHWLQQRHASLEDTAVAFGLPPPRGVLMLGVQGAGKSLCAKAIAAAWQRPLLRMDVGALYDRYVGESERRLRDALQQAEAMAPAILWIDEIEKAFASAASHNTDGGLSRRMFATLLTWMQEHREPVFLVATANDIEALPPELLRKGRFDEIFFVDLPDAGVREEILAIHLRLRGRDPAEFDVAQLATQMDGFSGAEIAQAVVAGLHYAYDERQPLQTRHLARAAGESPPLAVTMAEKVAALRRWAVGRCVPAD